jgi:hypothetical protein
VLVEVQPAVLIRSPQIAHALAFPVALLS